MPQNPVTPLLIVGAGGHGLEVAAYAHDMGMQLAGAIDDHKLPGPWRRTRIIGGLKELAAFCAQHEKLGYITAVGNNAVRRQLVASIAAKGIANLSAFSLKHALAWTGDDVEIGEGALLAPHSLATTQVRIGRHCILNVKASVSHECIVGDWCNINPGATICGDVRLGEGCYVGAGATVMEKRSIGAWTIVGAGSVVVDDLPAGVTAVGAPARIVKRQGVPSFA